MVEGDDFGDDGDVFSRIQIDGDLWQLHLEDCGGLDIQTQALDNGVLVPLLELNDDFNALLLANGAYSEDRRYVDKADASDLHIVSLHLVAAPDQHVVAAFAGNHQVVRNQAMAPFDKIENAFGLSNPAHAGEEESHSEYIGERSVQRHRGSELH